MERMDTHQTVKNLIASGLLEKQAEAITTAINTSDNLATKEDVKDLHGEIRLLEKDIKHIEEKMATKSDLNKMAFSIIKWVVGSSIAVFSSSIAVVIAFLSYYTK